MKVCFLNNDLSEKTGAGQFARNLLAAFAPLNPQFKPVVLVLRAHGDARERVIVPKLWRGLVRALPAIRREFRKADIIHALDGWPYGVLAAIANIGIGRPLIITAIGTGAIQPLYRWNAPFLRWAYRRADRVIAISDYTRREIVKKIPDLTINVINHGVNQEEFQTPALPQLSAEEQKHILAAKPYILSVGMAKARKGFEDSLVAFARIKRSIPELRYVIVGGGGGDQRLFPLIRALNIQNAVLFFKGATGAGGISRTQLVALYQNAELFLLLPVDDNKDVEGFGLVFLEAAAAGLPVIGTRESGTEDAVDEGKNGYLIAPGDVDAAAERAIEVLTSPALKERLQKASCVFAEKMSWERAARGYDAIYQSLTRRA